MFQAGEAVKAEAMESLVVRMVVSKGRRSSHEIYDNDTNVCASDLTEAEKEAKARRSRAAAGNKQMFRQVAKSFVTLKKKLTKCIQPFFISQRKLMTSLLNCPPFL